MQASDAQIPVVRVPGTLQMGAMGYRRLGKDAWEVTHLQRRFQELVAVSHAIRGIVARLETAGASVTIYGGWVRDHLATQSIVPRDIDLVVTGIDRAALQHLLEPPYRETMFGGFACEAGDYPFDIWPLAETFLIQKLRRPARIRSLLQVTDFTVNAIAFCPTTRARPASLVDGGCLSAIKTQCIDFVCDVLPFPKVQVGRLLVYATKLGFDLSLAAQGFIVTMARDQECYRTVKSGLRAHAPQYAAKAEALLDELVDSH